MGTPPRVFVDYQDEVVPHLEPGMVPSTVDPDAAGFAERGNKVPKRPVKLSAWKLAKLDSNEAMRAAAKARASSSVLRPVDNRRIPDPEMSSSGNMSVRSSVSTDMGGNKELKSELRLSPLRNLLLQVKVAGMNMKPGLKVTSVVWDQEAGRYVSVPVSASEARNRQPLQVGISNSNAETGSHGRRPAVPTQDSSSSAPKPSQQQAEKLMYTGDSIFFGGPLLSVPVRDGLRNDRVSGSREAQERVAPNSSRESRFKRDTASNQLPVFIPGGFEQNRPSGSRLK
ncbi:hypothetical protein L1049_024112 [Liquidambar formosana]|uniref:Uncharacterized protein n=1 Tax=Liquidambar formosana TaxID=63359 RepID=A0AAP0RUG1_LIQFO